MIQKNLENAWEELEAYNYRLNILENDKSNWIVKVAIVVWLIWFTGWTNETLHSLYFIDKCIEQGNYITVENRDLTCKSKI